MKIDKRKHLKLIIDRKIVRNYDLQLVAKNKKETKILWWNKK